MSGNDLANSAVLGLGNGSDGAGMPVMEGKCTFQGAISIASPSDSRIQRYHSLRQKGAIYEDARKAESGQRNEMAKVTNLAKKSVLLQDMLDLAQMYLSVFLHRGAVTTEMVKTIVREYGLFFACAKTRLGDLPG